MTALKTYDPATLELARQGDERALSSLIVAVRPDVRRYARQTCKTSADIEDAVQETLWLMYRRIGTLRAITSLSAWLFAVVHRECLRIVRRSLGMVTEDIENLEDDARLSHRPDDELRIDIARAMQSLPAHYREVVLLRDFKELTIDEIAESLNLTRESTKARLHRARTMMREYLLS